MRHQRLFRYGDLALCNGCMVSRTRSNRADIGPFNALHSEESLVVPMLDRLFSAGRKRQAVLLSPSEVDEIAGRCEDCGPAE